MADGLGVSRAMVWKGIEALRADGYVIESAPAKGYRLVSAPDLIGERDIAPRLKPGGFCTGIHSFDGVGSTNTEAMRLASEGAAEGALVVSDSQSSGRGRLGRAWVSPPGVNVYMSVILRPDVTPSEAPLITLAVSVALARAVRGLYGLPASIKWPNDLMVGSRKFAGILTEMNAEPERVRHVVAGVGVDVNMPFASFPPEIRETATSIMVELGRAVSRAELIARFMDELPGPYGRVVAGDEASVLDEWRGLSLTLGRMVKVNTLKGDVVGFARDIDEGGGLVIEKDGGGIERVTCGDVGFM